MVSLPRLSNKGSDDGTFFSRRSTKRMSSKASIDFTRFKGRSSKASIDSTRFNSIGLDPVAEKAIQDELGELVHLMDNNQTRLWIRMKDIVSRFATTTERRLWLSQWVDHRGLDLLHCTILNNLPNHIDYLLDAAKLFPSTYFPKSNPYAHLAAKLGFKACLAAVLNHRPGDYFATSERHHIVKIPTDIRKRLKIDNENSTLDKSIDRMVNTVKTKTHVAEIVMEHSEKSMSSSISDAPVKKSRRRTTPIPYQHFVPKLEENLRNHSQTLEHAKKLYPVRKRTENKITVHMDIFKHDTLDRKEQKLVVTEPASVTRISGQERKPILPVTQIRSSSEAEDKNRLTTAHNPRPKPQELPRGVEIGVRKFKKYKPFVPVIESRHIPDDCLHLYMNKTPLTLAAESNHVACVDYLLTKYHHKKTATVGDKNIITFAARARNPEAIAILMGKGVAMSDYQSALLLSLRELYPDSLSMLLLLGGKLRRKAFDGINLYHILYSQSLQDNYRTKMLPEMTRVLIQCQEDANAKKPPRTYPMYTLIHSAFCAYKFGDYASHYLKCLELLLHAHGDPYFNETIKIKGKQDRDLNRPPFISAVHCIFESVQGSRDRLVKRCAPQNLVIKFIEIIEKYDKTPRRQSNWNDVLFLYMKHICQVGSSPILLRTLLRCGGDPDVKDNGKYPLNCFFDQMLPFLTKFEIKQNSREDEDMLKTLLILSDAMTQSNLHRAVVHFLDNHLLSTPLQALSLTRRFCYHANIMIMSPRRLMHIASQNVWVLCGRDVKRVRKLPLNRKFMDFVVP